MAVGVCQSLVSCCQAYDLHEIAVMSRYLVKPGVVTCLVQTSFHSYIGIDRRVELSLLVLCVARIGDHCRRARQCTTQAEK